jgi:hypothetical protein
MARPIPLLLVLTREAMGIYQQELADLAGSSLRTVQRWENARSTPAPWHFHRLADAVRPVNAQLAAELDEYAPRPAPPVVVAPPEPEPPPPPLPPAPPPPPDPPPIADAILVDAVVCAAAEAMSVVPQAIRPAVLAAFTWARAARLTVEAVIAVLAPPEVEAATSRPRGAKKGA